MSDSKPQPATTATAPHRKRTPRWAIWSLCGMVIVAGACWTWAMAVDQAPPVQGYKIINTYPHDSNAFTQGLAFDDKGQLYEGTGLYNQTSLRRVNLQTGQVLQHYAEPSPLVFGEGIAVVDDQIVQLTWRNHYAIFYDRQTLAPFQRRLPYRGEGWGLTYDGTHLIMSDGSSLLKFLHPKTFRVVKFIRVKDGRREVSQLNELEYIKGEIYANVWHSDRIARISPQTGKVLGWIDLGGLLKPGDVNHDEAVLNGIAYDAKNDKLYVTGKNWPKLFEIELTN